MLLFLKLGEHMIQLSRGEEIICQNIKQQLSNFFSESESLGGFVKIQIIGSPKLISNKLSGDAYSSGLGNYTLRTADLELHTLSRHKMGTAPPSYCLCVIEED